MTGDNDLEDLIHELASLTPEEFFAVAPPARLESPPIEDWYKNCTLDNDKKLPPNLPPRDMVLKNLLNNHSTLTDMEVQGSTLPCGIQRPITFTKTPGPPDLPYETTIVGVPLANDFLIESLEGLIQTGVLGFRFINKARYNTFMRQLCTEHFITHGDPSSLWCHVDAYIFKNLIFFLDLILAIRIHYTDVEDAGLMSIN